MYAGWGISGTGSVRGKKWIWSERIEISVGVKADREIGIKGWEMEKDRIRRREKYIWIAEMLLLYLLVNAGFCYLQYRQYEEKRSLVYQVAESAGDEESMFVWAVENLKNGIKADHAQQVPRRLEEYGYAFPYRDAMFVECMRNCALLAAGSALLLLFGAAWIWREHWRGLSVQKAERDRISRQVLSLRQGNYDEVEQLEELDELGLASLAGQMKLISDRAKREKEETKALVTDISHQLRTPLAAMRECVDILGQDDLTDAEQSEFTERCSGQLLRLEELAAALLQISRMETGMIQVKLVRTPIFDTILMAVNRIYPRAQEKNIEIALEEDQKEQQISLMQDVRWLSEAFINILENAVKYSEPCSHITISTEVLQTFLRIEFADDGIGIPKAERNRVFQRFYRGADARVQKESGSGVGLYLTRQIIEQHYGTIRVQSARGHSGSVFVVQIPL